MPADADYCAKTAEAARRSLHSPDETPWNWYTYAPDALTQPHKTAPGTNEEWQQGTLLAKARRVMSERVPPAPLNEYEALMQAPPGVEPEESQVEIEARLEALPDAVAELLDEVLSPRERWIVDALFWRRLPLRHVEREMGVSKTQVARIRDGALGKLREHLSTSPEASRYLLNAMNGGSE